MAKVYLALAVRFDEPPSGTRKDKILWSRKMASEFDQIVQKYGGKFCPIKEALDAEKIGDWTVGDEDLLDGL